MLVRLWLRILIQWRDDDSAARVAERMTLSDVPALLTALEDESHHLVATRVPEILARLGVSSDVLYERWRITETSLQLCLALARMGDRRVLPALRIWAVDYPPWRRFEALAALALLGDQETLAGLVFDSDINISSRAIAGLGQCGQDRLVEALLSTPVREQRHGLLYAVTRWDPSFEPFLQDDHACTRLAALVALQRCLPERASLQARDAAYDQDPAIRSRAAAFLGPDDSELVLLVGDSQAQVRSAAAARLNDVDGLMGLLQDADFDVQLAAVRSLGQTGSAKALKALQSCVLSCTCRKERKRARRALDFARGQLRKALFA